MPRPTTKEDLIIVANSKFDKMWVLFDSLMEEQKKEAFEFDGNGPCERQVAVWASGYKS